MIVHGQGLRSWLVMVKVYGHGWSWSKFTIMFGHGQGLQSCSRLLMVKVYNRGWSWSLFKINSYLKDETDRVLKYCDKV